MSFIGIAEAQLKDTNIGIVETTFSPCFLHHINQGKKTLPLKSLLSLLNSNLPPISLSSNRAIETVKQKVHSSQSISLVYVSYTHLTLPTI